MLQILFFSIRTSNLVTAFISAAPSVAAMPFGLIAAIRGTKYLEVFGEGLVPRVSQLQLDCSGSQARAIHQFLGEGR